MITNYACIFVENTVHVHTLTSLIIIMPLKSLMVPPVEVPEVPFHLLLMNRYSELGDDVALVSLFSSFTLFWGYAKLFIIIVIIGADFVMTVYIYIFISVLLKALFPIG